MVLECGFNVGMRGFINCALGVVLLGIPVGNVFIAWMISS